MPRNEPAPPFEVLKATVVADELDKVTLMVERLSERLCGDERTLAEFSVDLQAFDLICQLQKSLSSVLRSTSIEGAFKGCVLEQLAIRLAIRFDSKTLTARLPRPVEQQELWTRVEAC